jgi:signal transduction histidine kinase
VRKFSVSEAIREIRDLVLSTVPPAICLEMSLAIDLPLVEADPTQIQQVVINLLTNAAEAIEAERGKIQIRTESRENPVCIEVRDTGRGMDTQTQSKMFDPFYSTKFLGRGLGRSSVAGIVRRQNGSIQVESSPGEGTVVTILLPPA